MLIVNYEFWGFVVVAMLAGVWMVRMTARRLRKRGATEPCRSGSVFPESQAEIEHRALMFLMTQKTDSVLAALARTIDEERQKLGVVVRNPTMGEQVDGLMMEAHRDEPNARSDIERVLPLAREGVPEAAIARRLNLPESEVQMVLRLRAA